MLLLTAPYMSNRATRQLNELFQAIATVLLSIVVLNDIAETTLHVVTCGGAFFGAAIESHL